MPTAAMSAAVRSALASAAGHDLPGVVPDLDGSCSTQPARGKDLLVLELVGGDDPPSWSKIMQRVEVVPWSMAATYCVVMLFPSRSMVR